MSTDADWPLGVTAVMLPELDLDEQIALCVELGITHLTLRPRVIPDRRRDEPYSNWGNHRFDLTPRRLADEGEAIRRRLTDAGLTPFGTVPHATSDQDEAELRLHFEGAAAVGAGRVRVNPGRYPNGVFDYAHYLDDTLMQLRRAEELAAPFGLKLVMETHSGSSVTSPGLAWAVCRLFDPQRIGMILDLPNFAREGMIAPGLAVSVIGPWIDHCHVGGNRRVTIGYDEAGFRRTQGLMCPVRDSDLHLPSWLAALREAGRGDVPLIIEDYTPDRTGAARLCDTAAAVRAAIAQ